MLSYFGDTNTFGMGTYGYFIQKNRDDNQSKTAISCAAADPFNFESSDWGRGLDDAQLHHVVSVLTQYEIKWYIDGELTGREVLSKINSIDPNSGNKISAQTFTPNSSIFVKVKAINKVFIYKDIVECDSYTWIDGNVYEENVDSLAYKKSDDSDTTFILRLTILPNEINNQSTTICAGQSVMIGDQEFTEAGEYVVILTNQFGCDSTVNLQLNVNQTFKIDNTTTYKVSDPKFESIGSRTLLAETINLLSQNNCYSVIYNYETYNYEAEFYTDTTFMSVIDTLIIDIETGIDGTPLPQAMQVKLYPNPAHTNLNISLSNWQLLAGYSLSIFDLAGTEIESIDVNNSELSIDVSNFTKGAYLVNIQKDGKILINKKLIIK